MNKIIPHKCFSSVCLMLIYIMTFAGSSMATIGGITGTTFNLTAKSDHIYMPDGGTALMWGYADADGSGRMQYPGPTLIINQGDTITVNLTNQLTTTPVSIVFPGQSNVTTTGGTMGLITNEAAASGGTVSYSFTAMHPGTYQYHSGTRSELQIEMGLVGAIIVRPENFDSEKPTAYDHSDSAYDREYLFLLTEMDPVIHQQVEFGMEAMIDNTTYYPVYWFINGRCAPDTMLAAGFPLLPTQPYNCMPRLHPGEKILLRMIGGGRDAHPFHTHGNNFTLLARDGKPLSSSLGAQPDLAVSDFTQTVDPGGTYDSIFTWSGKDLGWDIYGDLTDPDYAHDCTDVDPADGFDDTTYEYCADHGKTFPIVLPETREMALGAAYSGSPFLGDTPTLPPGQGGLNANGGYFFMWHSHNEKEMVNFDIFPGGLMTMLIIEPHDVPID